MRRMWCLGCQEKKSNDLAGVGKIRTEAQLMSVYGLLKPFDHYSFIGIALGKSLICNEFRRDLEIILYSENF
jgi:hypothetical protein